MSNLASSLAYQINLVQVLICITRFDEKAIIKTNKRSVHSLTKSIPIRQLISSKIFINYHRQTNDQRGQHFNSLHSPRPCVLSSSSSLKSLRAKERVSLYRQNHSAVPVYTDQSLSSYTVTNRSHLLVQMRSFLSITNWWMDTESVKHQRQTHTEIT